MKFRIVCASIIFVVCITIFFHPGINAAAQKFSREAVEIGGFNFQEGSGAVYVNEFEESIGRDVYTVMFYQALTVPDFATFPVDVLDEILTHDGYNTATIPMITLEPAMTLTSINAGDYDAQISAYAASAAAWGHALRIRFAHEMIQNDVLDGGEWYDWQDQPEAYKAAFQRFVTLFRAQNADQVSFVWCPNHYPFDAEIVQKYYPGETYVDWLCMDGYNWTNQNNNAGVYPDWSSFDQIFSPLYNVLTGKPEVYGVKPIMIGEFGSCEAGEYDLPENTKAGWITDTLNTLKGETYPAIRAFYWFNADKTGIAQYECDWRVNSSPESENAFRAAIDDPIFLSHFTLDYKLFLPGVLR